MRRLLLSAIVAGPVVALANTSFGCGYHDPSKVAAGILNWAYPRALYVRQAVWHAEGAGLIARREHAAQRDLFAMQRTAVRLKKLAEHLSRGGLSTSGGLAFSVVLIDTVMWARFRREVGSSRWEVLVHAEGPEPGDVVIVSHTKVISELASRTMTAEAAHAHGLIRYYGAEGQAALLKQVLETSWSGQRAIAGEPSN